MELKEGYKQTEIGVIPEDWEVFEFGQISRPSNVRINPKISGGGDTCIELEHINKNSGSINGTTLTSSKSSIKNIFAANDILFGKLRSYLRKYYFSNFDGVCSTEIWVLKPRFDNIDMKYIYQIVQSDRFINISSEAYGTHMPRADWNVVSQEKFPFPPSKTEQTAIAKALSDADAWIQSLTQLIAKKRQIKQGAMQALLTGKIRIPGFKNSKNYKKTVFGTIPDDWEIHTIGDFIEFQGGSQPSKNVFSLNKKEGYIRLIQIRDYKTDKYKTYIPYSLARRFCDESDIMIGRYGPPIFQILKGIKGAYNVALIKAIPSGRVDKNYAYYYLKQEKLFSFIEKLSQRSSGQTGIDLKELKNYPLIIPPTINEQKSIASLLVSMDKEVTELENKLNKAKLIKQGMMQNLLTGRIRLI